MTCRVCQYVEQFIENGLCLCDHALNWLTLGDSSEMVSARVARARLAGWRWAAVACRVLTWGAKVVTFGRSASDHCTYALNAKLLGLSKEIFDLNEMRFRVENVVKVEELEG